MAKTILLIGSLDSKGAEYAFVAELIRRRGHQTLVVDFGVMGEAKELTPDITSEMVAVAGGSSLESLRQAKDRGAAMTVMSQGVVEIVRDLYDQGKFHGVFGMGGTGGTSVISAAMRSLPFGVPKVIVSTAASGQTAPYVGTRDITMIPSIVDVAGVNQISRMVFSQAVGAICGMVEQEQESQAIDRPVIAATMFGNTTACVDQCREALSARGYEVLVFHCTGTGGRTMEDLVRDGLVQGILDITTTEWADELCGGIFPAGQSRLEAAGAQGIPHLIVPGCVDMVNFGAPETVPERYQDRLFVKWNPSITLMRTTPQENAELGRIFAQKANRAKGPVAFLLPLKGVSILDSEGQEFWWPEADRAMFDAIKEHVRPGIHVEEIDANINDHSFSDRAVELFLSLINQKGV